jgi:hypothetical protein
MSFPEAMEATPPAKKNAPRTNESLPNGIITHSLEKESQIGTERAKNAGAGTGAR